MKEINGYSFLEVPEGSSDFSITYEYNPLCVWLHMKGREFPMPIGNIIHPAKKVEIIGLAKDLTEEQWKGIVEAKEEEKEYKMIELTKGYFAKIDAEEYDKVAIRKWSVEIKNRRNYAKCCIGSKTTLMHRHILGITDTNIHVDHINHNGLDNRKSNLRISTVLQNSFNRRSNNGSTSQYKGVSWKSERNKWRAEIRVGGKDKQLGYFNSEIEAARKYDAEAKAAFGEFAFLNFPYSESGHSLLKANGLSINNCLILKNENR